MKDARLRSIRSAERTYERAGNKSRWLLNYAGLARLEEMRKALKLRQVYEEALGAGFFIEKVDDPSRLTFLAGYEVHGQAADYTIVEKWEVPDKDHIAAITGQFALAVAFTPDLDGILARDFSMYRLEVPDQVQMQVSFRLAGFYDNADTNGYPRYDRGSTHYRGELSAMTYRLPTSQEIAGLGRTAVER